MKSQYDRVALLCALLGGIVNAYAILKWLKDFNNILIPTLVLFTSSFIAIIIYLNNKIRSYKNKINNLSDEFNDLSNKYDERCEFINFIQFLFDNDRRPLNLLPKICLAVDKDNRLNNLYIHDLSIEYICDLRSVDTSNISNIEQLKRKSSIEYTIRAKNKNLPKNIFFYFGNTYAEIGPRISQKHGTQTEYKEIEKPKNADKKRNTLEIQLYQWPLDSVLKERKQAEISLMLEYKETNFIHSSDTVIFYPRQFGKHIDSITFELKVLCNKEILEDVKLYRIEKDGGQFRYISMTDIDKKRNSATAKTFPNNTGYEAYILRVYWKL